MQLATFGQIASFVEPRSGQRLPIRYLAHALDDASISLLAASLVERVGDGGWARQLPDAEAALDLRPRLFVLMAMRAAEGVTFVGAGARLLLDRGVTAMWSGEQPIDALITLAGAGDGSQLDRQPGAGA